MADGLRALEKSVKRPLQTRALNATGPRNEGGLASSARPYVPTARSKLQEQIDVVRGKRPGQASSSLRVLEARLTGRSTPAATSQKQTQRLDFGQAPGAINPPAADRMPLPPVREVALSTWSAPIHPGYAGPGERQFDYLPEFSAPHSARFHVEPFDTGEPSDTFAPVPQHRDASPAEWYQRSPLAPEPDVDWSPGDRPDNSTRPADDSAQWLQDDPAPTKISSASRNSLNGSAALAKEDFERDLAAILGTPPVAESAPSPSANPPTPTTEPTASASPPHPSHAIFDQMGSSMRYANSFDLGAIKLQERFDQFDRELMPTPAKQKPEDTSSKGLFVNPYAEPLELDEFDLMAELAEIGDEYPQLAKTRCEHTETEAPGDQRVVAREPDAQTTTNPIHPSADTAGDRHE